MIGSDSGVAFLIHRLVLLVNIQPSLNAISKAEQGDE